MITWKTEKRKISELIPSKYNPRKASEKDANDLKESLEQFNLAVPIIINTNNTIIGGHFRHRILVQKYGNNGTEIDVRVPSRQLTDKEERELNLRLNKNLGVWDFDMLGNFDNDLLKKVGFESKEMDRIFQVSPSPRDDEMPKSTPVRAKLGDIWALGRHRVMCGDSTQKEAVSALMSGKKADMVFTDPPWNVSIGLDSNPKHRQRKGLINDSLGEKFLDFLQKFSVAMIEFVKGDIYCVMGCEEWPNIHKALTDVGLHWSSTIIWLKDIFVLGRSKYHRRYEPIWYGWKDKSSFVGDRKQDDVFEVARPKRSDEHPTMKPVELVIKAILNSSEQGDIVLDLFMGGGSTLIACEKTNRICYGMELDPRYVDVIVKRWEDFTHQKAKKLNG